MDLLSDDFVVDICFHAWYYATISTGCEKGFIGSTKYVPVVNWLSYHLWLIMEEYYYQRYLIYINYFQVLYSFGKWQTFLFQGIPE